VPPQTFPPAKSRSAILPANLQRIQFSPGSGRFRRSRSIRLVGIDEGKNASLIQATGPAYYRRVLDLVGFRSNVTCQSKLYDSRRRIAELSLTERGWKFAFAGIWRTKTPADPFPRTTPLRRPLWLGISWLFSYAGGAKGPQPAYRSHALNNHHDRHVHPSSHRDRRGQQERAIFHKSAMKCRSPRNPPSTGTGIGVGAAGRQTR